MEDVQTRRATLDDLAPLLGMLAAFSTEDGHEYDAGRIRAALDPLLTDDAQGQVWLLEHVGGDPGSRPLGYAVLTWGWSLESGGREGLLDEFFVAEAWRRGGLGSVLIERVLAEAGAAGCRALFLETERRNDGARAFYGRHGLTAQDSIWMSREVDQP